MRFSSARTPPIFPARNEKTLSIFLLIIIIPLLASCITSQASRAKIDISSIPDAIGRAQSLFNETPRTLEHVAGAYRLIARALKIQKATDLDHYRHVVLASRYAVWLSYHHNDKFEKTRYSKAAISHADQSVSLKGMGVAGYYYRAIATGLYVQQSPLSVANAMQKIRSDAMTAIKLDRIYDNGGPCRVLGGLYLRAPGPPIGLGSIKKALKYLKQAQDIAPKDPENNLLLAEAFLKINKNEPAEALLKSILIGESKSMQGVEGKKRRQRALRLFQHF